MSLDYSVAHLMNRLADWAFFPKYQLERRVDIFLTPFIEQFVSAQLGQPAVIVAPEFPILRDLDVYGPKVDVRAMKLKRHTVNVDYLVHLPTTSTWLFVELKTDTGSFDSTQADRYAVARARGMHDLLRDIEYVVEKTAAEAKYRALRNALPPATEHDRIQIAYLAPKAMTEAQHHVYRGPFATIDQLRTVDEFFPLETFAEQSPDAVPAEHADLWAHVRNLLRAVGGPDVRDRG